MTKVFPSLDQEKGFTMFCVALSFSLESRDPVRFPCELFRQNLDRHFAAKNLILCLKHFAHTALAELTCDLVMPERFANHETILHADNRCNAKSSLEVGVILTNLDNAGQ
jgi:hypothetical protein